MPLARAPGHRFTNVSALTHTETPAANRSAPTLTASVILPVHNQADHIGEIVASYLDVLSRLPQPVELILVTNACSDASTSICATLADNHRQVRSIDLAEGGWGRAVRAGLAEAAGDLLCYTNAARTTRESLVLALNYAFVYPSSVIKANRRVRDSPFRRLGSLLYNLECRVLFDLPTWDINGTPKVFPRAFDRLLALTRDDDLIDAEFAIVCQQQDYPEIELPIRTTPRHGGETTTNLRSAMCLYLGAYRLRRQLGVGRASAP